MTRRAWFSVVLGCLAASCKQKPKMYQCGYRRLSQALMSIWANRPPVPPMLRPNDYIVSIPSYEALTRGLSLPLMRLGEGALKAAKDFEESFANVARAVDASKSDEMAKTFRWMAKEIPLTRKERRAAGLK